MTKKQRPTFTFSWRVSGWTYGTLEAGTEIGARFTTTVLRQLRSIRTVASSVATRATSVATLGRASGKRKD